MGSVDRVIQFIEFKRISKRVFYRETGISNGYLDKVKGLGARKMEIIISVYPELSFEWLLTGQGQMLADYPHSQAAIEGSPNIREGQAGYENLKEQLLEKERLIHAKDQIIVTQQTTISSLKDMIELLKSQAAQVTNPH